MFKSKTGLFGLAVLLLLATLLSSKSGTWADSRPPDAAVGEIPGAVTRDSRSDQVNEADHGSSIMYDGKYLDLASIKIAIDAEGECPGVMPGEDGSPRILDVSGNLSTTNSLIQNLDVRLSEAAEAWVEYYPKNQSGKILKTRPTPNPDTAHRIQVMRLTADTEYCYQVYARASSDGGPVSDSFPGQFLTGPIPVGLAGSTFNKTFGNQTYGLTLLDFNDNDFSGLVALDEDARLVWYYQHAFPVFAAAQKENLNLVFGLLNGRNFVEIRPDGTRVRRITDLLEDGTPCAPAGRWHHEALVRPGGKVLFMGSEIRDVNFNGVFRKQTGDTIVEWDQAPGTVSTLVSLFDLLDPARDRTGASNTKAGPHAFFWLGCQEEFHSEDWTHANSIWVADDGSVIVSIRHLNQVIAIAPDLQSVLWRLGGPGSDFSFPDSNDQFYFQHTASLTPDGNVLLFDNGDVRPPAEGGQYSRALELELDFVRMEAKRVWEYRATPDLYAPCCSSAERLENGNTVIAFGGGAGNICCRVFTLVEADPQGSSVAAIEITSLGKGIQYRAYALDSINGESAIPASTGSPACNGLAATITGTNGPDIIQGTSGDDVILGLGGDDTIDGGGGQDTICGGPGNDRISGGDRNDWISGDAGNDRLMGGPGYDVLIGGRGEDWLYGGNLRDWLFGGDGNDFLFGQLGPDILDGGSHDDIIVGGSGDDAMACGPGIDAAYGQGGSGDTAAADCETVTQVP